MLSDEEKEALRNFKSEYETCDHYSSDLIIELDDAETILNLIEKQDKIIQAIATNLVEHIGTCPIDYDDDFENEKCERCQNTYAECWIEYFTKKVGE